MMLYAIVKTVHILSATILFGTGLGTAWFMWRSNRSGDVVAIATTARNVVLADWLFTMPTAVIQPISGFWLAYLDGYSPAETWLILTYCLYLLAGACWLPVVWLQVRMRDLAVSAVADGVPLSALYRRYARTWFALGWPAFSAVVLIVYLMVARP